MGAQNRGYDLSPRSETELEEGVETLRYELQGLQFLRPQNFSHELTGSIPLSVQSEIVRAGGIRLGSWVNNARIESYCVHWRQVFEFLTKQNDAAYTITNESGKKEKLRNHVRAGHYFSDADGMWLPHARTIWNGRLRQWSSAVSQQVAHLTFGRKNPDDKIEWPCDELAGELARLLTKCAGLADRCSGPLRQLAQEFSAACGSATRLEDVDYYRVRNRRSRTE